MPLPEGGITVEIKMDKEDDDADAADQVADLP